MAKVLGLDSSNHPIAMTITTSGGLTDHSGTITTGGTAQVLMPANPTRTYLAIQNISGGDLWFNFTTTAVLNEPSFKLTAGSAFTMEGGFVSNEAISIIGATTGQAFTAKDG